ncbi:MAG: hypothetical protein ABR585_07390 [Gemmatimonadaceae bacterium]
MTAPEITLTAHTVCDEVARLVAAELPAHNTHATLLRQDDTLGLATELLRARPTDDSDRARWIREGLEIAIRVALIRAGIPADTPGTHHTGTETER